MEPVRVDVFRHCPQCAGDVVIRKEGIRPVGVHCRGLGGCNWYQSLDVVLAERYIVVACLRS
jgi:hypothetical protein